MAEESVINYWEKYGNIAFDNGQKAVLTSCLLKNPDTANSPTSPSGRAGVINCCFSFTIRRDKYNMYISTLKQSNVVVPVVLWVTLFPLICQNNSTFVGLCVNLYVGKGICMFMMVGGELIYVGV